MRHSRELIINTGQSHIKCTTLTISSIFYFLLKSLPFATLFITTNPHIWYEKHLAFIPSTLRYGILENGSSTQVNHTETYYYDNKLNFYVLLESFLFATLYITNNPHIGYGKHLAFTPSTKPRYGILENGSSTQVNHTETYYYDNKLNFLFFIGIPSICDPLYNKQPAHRVWKKPSIHPE